MASSRKLIVYDTLSSDLIDEFEDRLLNGSNSNDDEWDMLSENLSTEGEGMVMVTTNGSVKSLNSFSEQSNITDLSISLRRIPSSSTIDTADGDHALGILDIDYVEHIVLPSDTLQGICLAYKTNQTRLRQANNFSGHSLTGAPRKLIVPLSQWALRSGLIRVQNQDTIEYKIYAFLANFPIYKVTQAKEILERANWNMGEAIEALKTPKV